MLVHGQFSAEPAPCVSLKDILLHVPDSVLLQLAHSVEGEDASPGASAVMAASSDLRRFQFTFDSG